MFLFVSFTFVLCSFYCLALTCVITQEISHLIQLHALIRLALITKNSNSYQKDTRTPGRRSTFSMTGRQIRLYCQRTVTTTACSTDPSASLSTPRTMTRPLPRRTGILLVAIVVFSSYQHKSNESIKLN